MFKTKLHEALLIVIFSIVFNTVSGQVTDSLLTTGDLPSIVNYALRNQPTIKQYVIDQEITDLQIKNRLADWYPQLNFNANYQRNFQLPTNIIGGNPVRLGVGNVSALQFTGTQNIFNRDALLASRTKNDVRLLAAKQTEDAKITLVANVAKNYFDLLATEQQRKVIDQNIVLFTRSLKDARARYDVGITDKTDYQRATIALNNAIASKKEVEESLKAKTVNLKYLINYPMQAALPITYDSAALEKEIFLDTLEVPDYSTRVEYQQLQAQLRLQDANVSYNKWSYIPSVNANGAYIRNFQNDKYSKLYGEGFSNSYAGLTLAFPIFQGGKRKNNIIIAQRQSEQARLDLVSFLSRANSEFATAMSQYKTSMANYIALKENMKLAEEVFNIISLQYREGIKTYLEVITAQTDLRTAQINYFNAIYGLLSSKIDVQKAEGRIQVQ